MLSYSLNFIIDTYEYIMFAMYKYRIPFVNHQFTAKCIPNSDHLG